MRQWETRRQGAGGGILGGFQFQCGNLRFLALNRTDRFQPQRASSNPHLVSPLNTSPIHWLFGRSSAGKTTLAKILQSHWRSQGWPTLLLDGDDLRSGVCAGLGFSRADRLENHRRMAEIAKLAASQGLRVIVASMAPEQVQRRTVEQILGPALKWIYVHAPLSLCIQRDPKGLYRTAQAGQLSHMLNYPFDEPAADEVWLWLDSGASDAASCGAQLVRAISPSSP